MSDFKSKKVWIIGASAGIGEALARLLSAKGHEIYISARSLDDLEDIKRSCATPDICHALPFDVTNIQEVEKAANQAKDFDIMIFAAGVYTPGSLKHIDLDDFKKTIDINLFGAINIFTALKDRIYSGKQAHLAWIASSSAYRALPNSNAYGISKAGLQYFCQIQRMELPKNVKIQMINPGFVKSRLTEKNKFKMPFLMTAENAAEIIYKGLQRDIFDIHFPKALTFILKFLSYIPDWLYLRIMKRST